MFASIRDENKINISKLNVKMERKKIIFRLAMVVTTDLSGLRLLMNDSKMDLCIGFLSTSSPDKPIRGWGVVINSDGSMLVSADIFTKPKQ